MSDSILGRIGRVLQVLVEGATEDDPNEYRAVRGYGVGTGAALASVPIVGGSPISESNPLPISGGGGGFPPNFQTVADVSVGITETTILNSSFLDRRIALIQNLDDTNFIRIGDTNVSASRGLRLDPGETITIDTLEQINGIADTAAVDVAIITFSE